MEWVWHSLPTERRSETWQCGARTTTSNSTSARPRSRSWTTGNMGVHTPIHIDRDTVERVMSFKFFCVHITEDLTCTLTPAQLWRRHSSASAPSRSWNDLAWPYRSSGTFTTAQSRASWLVVSESGMATAPPSASLGASSQPSRMYMPGGVWERPGKLLKSLLHAPRVVLLSGVCQNIFAWFFLD